MKEEWKDIYNGYEISNFGNIRRFKNDKYIYLKTNKDSSGYLNFSMYINKKQKTNLIHHLVWDYFGGEKRNGRKIVVDHIDENKTNNRIDNLQLLTHRNNISKNEKYNKSNTSKYVGVSWDKTRNKWVSKIKINGKQIFLGRYKTEEEASNAYQKELNKIS